MLALKVTAAFEPKIKDGLVSVEDIQDSVESVLIQAGYDDVAKGYILYRKQREKIRNLNSTLLDYKEIVGSIAGDDTIMLAIRTVDDCLTVMERIRDIVNGQKEN